MEENTNYPQLYELAIPESEVSHTHGPVLVHAFEGFLDAGHTIEQFTRIIKDQSELQLIASFDIDEMFDYRSRRPKMKLKNSQLSEVFLPKLELFAAIDKQGNPFLLLTGQEPDYRWQRFTVAIEELAKRYGVTKIVGIHAIPTGVPHTRPVVINAHSNNPEFTEGLETWDQEFSFSSSMSTFLDYNLGIKGFDTLGLVVHVPHYLQQAEYPESTRALLHEFNRVAGVDIDTTEISHDAALFMENVDEQVNQSDEARILVDTLEQQYDSFMNDKLKEQNILAEAGALPTGDEIADELEKFLANLNNFEGEFDTIILEEPDFSEDSDSEE